jgi:hypothetical protein
MDGKKPRVSCIEAHNLRTSNPNASRTIKRKGEMVRGIDKSFPRVQERGPWTTFTRQRSYTFFFFFWMQW